MGLTTSEAGELATAKKRIRELESDLAVSRWSVELLKGETSPKGEYAAIAVMAAENLPVQVACRTLAVSESGFYEHRNRTPSERSVRHTMLTDLITGIHTAAHGIYGARRIHAELTLGRGVAAGHNQVELLMRRAGLQGVTGRCRWKRNRPDHIATDHLERDFNPSGPNQLWVTDITEHPLDQSVATMAGTQAREGKVYCAVILDTYSRKGVGWSIEASPTGSLVTSALGMAIEARLYKDSEPGTILHSDQGVQFGSWAFTQRAKDSGLLASMGSIGDCYDCETVDCLQVA